MWICVLCTCKRVWHAKQMYTLGVYKLSIQALRNKKSLDL